MRYSSCCLYVQCNSMHRCVVQKGQDSTYSAAGTGQATHYIQRLHTVQCRCCCKFRSLLTDLSIVGWRGRYEHLSIESVPWLTGDRDRGWKSPRLDKVCCRVGWGSAWNKIILKCLWWRHSLKSAFSFLWKTTLNFATLHHDSFRVTWKKASITLYASS